jgi:hypothetical protein
MLVARAIEALVVDRGFCVAATTETAATKQKVRAILFTMIFTSPFLKIGLWSYAKAAMTSSDPAALIAIKLL